MSTSHPFVLLPAFTTGKGLPIVVTVGGPPSVFAQGRLRGYSGICPGGMGPSGLVHPPLPLARGSWLGASSHGPSGRPFDEMSAMWKDKNKTEPELGERTEKGTFKPSAPRPAEGLGKVDAEHPTRAEACKTFNVSRAGEHR